MRHHLQQQDRPEKIEQKVQSPALQFRERKNKNKLNCKNYINFIFELKLVLSKRLKETIGQNLLSSGKTDRRSHLTS